MKIGVVGANGFVGRSLCSKFLSEQNTVFAFFHKFSELIPKKCLLIHIEADFNEKLDCIVIAIGGYNCNYQQYLEQYLLIEKIIRTIKFDKIIYISSVEVYGRNKKIISVNCCFNNPNAYGLSKICQEFLIKSVEDYTIIRPTYLFGNGMNQNSLLPTWINMAKDKLDIVVYGDGKRKQDYLHIDDLTELCWLSILNDVRNSVVIAATGESVSNDEIAKEISNNASNSHVKYSGVDNTESSQFDISFTQELFNWTPKNSVKKWLKEIT
jgi:UDP-glucose 4-epimerase